MRRLVQLLALLLVPVVIVSTPNVAQAAVTYGSWANAKVQWSALVGSFSCSINARNNTDDAGASVVQVRNSVCLAPVGRWTGGDSYVLTFNGADGNGDSCSVGGSGVLTEHEDDTWTKELTRLEQHDLAVTDPLGIAGMCDFTEVCIGAGVGEYELHCASIVLPATEPAAAPGAGDVCGWTWEYAAFVECLTVSGFPSLRWDPSEAWCPWLTQAQTQGEPHVISLARTFPAAVGTNYTVTELQSAGAWGHSSYAGPVVDLAGSTSTCRTAAANITRPSGTADVDVVLYRAYRTYENQQSGWKIMGGPEARIYVKGASSTSAYPGDWTSGDTPPDDPAPAEDPAPVDTGNGSKCTFSWSDPSTWASAGICAVVHLLTKVWEAIDGVPGAILDGLVGLFVPSDGFMEAKADQLKDAWGQTAPLVVLDGVQDLGDSLVIAQPPGACEGPSLDFATELTGAVSLSPLSTCRSQIATLASIIKTALTVVVYVGAFLAGVRIIGSAFGVDLSMSKGGDTI